MGHLSLNGSPTNLFFSKKLQPDGALLRQVSSEDVKIARNATVNNVKLVTEEDTFLGEAILFQSSATERSFRDHLRLQRLHSMCSENFINQCSYTSF